MNSTQTLFNYVDSLIRENKTSDCDGYYLDVDDLHDSDKEDFAAHLIEFNSFNKEGWDFLLDDVYREELASTFSSYILSYGEKKEDLKDAFLNGLKQSAIKVYRNQMQNLIDDRIGDVYHEDQWEAKHPCDRDDWDYQELHA
jgi:hypothetical protein